VRFLDPCTKSGVFLREITRRLTEGLKGQIPDLQERVDHILTKQVFGIGITQLTAMLARRSVYCTKHANGEHSIAKSFASDAGNIWFERSEHDWKDGKCQYCGASQQTLDRGEELETHAYAFIHTEDIQSRLTEIFETDMQFDVIIGNPPYQLDDGGFGTSAAPIYQLFVQQAKALEPRYLSMVIPARWFAGGKGLDEFREAMLDDDRLRSIDDYLSASDVFPGVGLKGGVCYFLWDRENPGACRVTTHFKDWPDSIADRPLLEDGADIFIRFNEGLSILKKVVAVETGQTNSLALPDEKRFDQLVSSRKPFGLETTFKGKASKGAKDVLVYQNGGTGYIDRSTISTGTDLIDKWKLFAGYAAPGTGNKDTYPHRIISTPFVAEPGTISSETYLC
jgi:site-specific DNA-methyltransferase (adenine-specific)